MERLLFVLIFLSVLGSGLMAGLFFAFSAFIMTALGRLPPSNGTAAMQVINVTILNPLFFLVFFGTPVLCLVLAAVALVRLPEPDAVYLLAGSLFYLVGSFGVTMVFNVPLNNRLAAVEPDSTEGAGVWTRYLSIWTTWNHVRTIACLAAMASFIMALR